MAFPQQPIKTPVSIGNLFIVLKDWPAALSGEPAGQSAHFGVDIVYSDGSKSQLTGNLVPHLTPAQLTQLQSFMTAMRDKAVAELL